MLLELADLRILPGQQAEFEKALQHGIQNVLSKAEGFRGCAVRKGIESPERYLVMIDWTTLESHTVGFREGPLFPQWRAIIGPYFASSPVVEHFTALALSDPA